MKKALFIMAFLMVCGSAFSQIEPVEKTKDYWVYVCLEDKSGVTQEDDAGRSKAGDVVAVLPVTKHLSQARQKKR